MKPVCAEARHDTVVHHKAALAQHDAVTQTAWREAAQRIDVDAVEKLGCVAADDLDLAERRGVEQADGAAHRFAFAFHGVMHGLAGAREIMCALP